MRLLSQEEKNSLQVFEKKQQNGEGKNASSAADIFKIPLNNVSKINTCKKVEKEQEAGLRQTLIGEFFKFLFRGAEQSPG